MDYIRFRIRSGTKMPDGTLSSARIKMLESSIPSLTMNDLPHILHALARNTISLPQTRRGFPLRLPFKLS